MGINKAFDVALNKRLIEVVLYLLRNKILSNKLIWLNYYKQRILINDPVSN